MTRTVLLILAALALAGCATTPDANYNAYIEANARADQQAAIAHAALADAAACNGDPTCVVSVKALASMAVQSGGNRAPIQQHVRQAGAAERVTLGLLGALPGFVQVWATIESGKNNVDIARINADRDARRDDAWAGVATGVADAFGVAAQTPTYQIGGNLGDTAIAGRDMWGNENRVGPDTQISTGAINTGTQNDGGVIGSGQIGNGRQNAPGPWTGNNDGAGCVGPGCQRLLLPEPEEPEGE